MLRTGWICARCKASLSPDQARCSCGDLGNGVRADGEPLDAGEFSHDIEGRGPLGITRPIVERAV